MKRQKSPPPPRFHLSLLEFHFSKYFHLYKYSTVRHITNCAACPEVTTGSSGPPLSCNVWSLTVLLQLTRIKLIHNNHTLKSVFGCSELFLFVLFCVNLTLFIWFIDDNFLFCVQLT